MAGRCFGRARAFVVEISADPSIADARGVRGLPDVHGLEVRSVRVWIANPLDDREHSIVVEFLEAVHAWVKADALFFRELEDVVFGDRDACAGAVVLGVAEGDDGVEPVVAARELHDDEDVILWDAGDG